MSEQENKTLTAVEIERELRERRQKELEQADKTDKEEDSGRPANSLGIEKLKKSRKGLIIIVAAFVLLAAGVSVYYVPSIIRSMSSNDEKPASSDVATGSVKRQTGLSDDVDPFNSDQKTQGGQEEKKGITTAGKLKQRQKAYSITSAVRLMCLMVAVALRHREVPAAPQHKQPVKPKVEVIPARHRRSSLLMPERPYRCRKLPGFPMIPIYLFQKIRAYPVHWTESLSLISQENWSARLILTFTVPTVM